MPADDRYTRSLISGPEGSGGPEGRGSGDWSSGLVMSPILPDARRPLPRGAPAPDEGRDDSRGCTPATRVDMLVW
ncbi:hypothetical protein GCM10010269_42310 [Streptomyces humidus]|uniref:Uncharacterized protein n=1 Tax=Streptomyces humidus TaxID=52259 RepID=A0A918L4U7_9ACTN|nr:hypothetical protein GCM10010269_42310 [Streptomyces humidus]